MSKKGKMKKGQKPTSTTTTKASLGAPQNDPTAADLAEQAESVQAKYTEDRLKKQLVDICAEIAFYKEKIDTLRSRNEWLKAEVNSCRTDGRDYVSYLVNKSKKKQAMIETLEAENVSRREKLVAERKQMEQQYASRREHLVTEATSLEREISEKEAQILDMKEVSDRRRKQQNEIDRLQKLIVETSKDNERELEEIRSTAVLEKLQYQREINNELSAMDDQVNKVAEKCMREHEGRQRKENEALRIKLAELNSETKRLEVTKQRLLERTKIQKEDRAIQNMLQQKHLKRIQAAIEKEQRRKESLCHTCL